MTSKAAMLLSETAVIRQGGQLECEHLTFGVPVLILLCASLEPGWNLSYFQKTVAKGSSMVILDVD
jgi:hypothetical protein